MYDTAMAVTCSGSQRGQRPRLAIRPITPAPKGQDAENKEVRVGWPSEDGQGGHG